MMKVIALTAHSSQLTAHSSQLSREPVGTHSDEDGRRETADRQRQDEPQGAVVGHRLGRSGRENDEHDEDDGGKEDARGQPALRVPADAQRLDEGCPAAPFPVL